MEKLIILLLSFICLTAKGQLGTIDSADVKHYTYEISWGITTNKPLIKEPYRITKFFGARPQGLKNLNPFYNVYSLKFGIENQTSKVEVGYFYFFTKVTNKSNQAKSNYFGSGIEFNYFYIGINKEYKRFKATPYLAYGLNLGSYNFESITNHRFGLGGEFDIKLYKGFYFRNNTSINYFSNGFPMFILSQFYLGFRF